MTAFTRFIVQRTVYRFLPRAACHLCLSRARFPRRSLFFCIRSAAHSNIVVECHGTRHRERFALSLRFPLSSPALSAGRTLFTCITERRGDYQLRAMTHSYRAHHGSRCCDNPLQFLRPDVARSMESYRMLKFTGLQSNSQVIIIIMRT